jgi:two-component system, OmpR family, KDP operon response regulator KdpE
MTRRPLILVIDEDPSIRTLLRRALRAAGYEVQDGAPDQAHPLKAAQKRPVDLLIFDVDAQTGGGRQTIQKLRSLSPMPILALSFHSDEDAIVDVLTCGADDFVTKPFSLKEIVARVENALRRRARQQAKPTQVFAGDLEIDLLHRRVRARGQETHLSPRLYEVLRVLAEKAGATVKREDILGAVWGKRRRKRVAYLRLAIRELRRRLEIDPANPRHILTEIKVGYRLEAEKNARSGIGSAEAFRGGGGEGEGDSPRSK